MDGSNKKRGRLLTGIVLLALLALLLFLFFGNDNEDRVPDEVEAEQTDTEKEETGRSFTYVDDALNIEDLLREQEAEQLAEERAERERQLAEEAEAERLAEEEAKRLAEEEAEAERLAAEEAQEENEPENTEIARNESSNISNNSGSQSPDNNQSSSNSNQSSNDNKQGNSGSSSNGGNNEPESTPPPEPEPESEPEPEPSTVTWDEVGAWAETLSSYVSYHPTGWNGGPDISISAHPDEDINFLDEGSGEEYAMNIMNQIQSRLNENGLSNTGIAMHSRGWSITKYH